MALEHLGLVDQGLTQSISEALKTTNRTGRAFTKRKNDPFQQFLYEMTIWYLQNNFKKNYLEYFVAEFNQDLIVKFVSFCFKSF